MDSTLLISLAIVHFIALMSPGPDFAIIVKLATQQQRSVALSCAFGIALAILAHTLLSLMGISLMIRQSEIAYSIVQFVGISYLAWMGVGALKAAISQIKANKVQKQLRQNTLDSSGEIDDEPQTAPLSNFQGFRIGLLTNMLNPKALIFFITLFTVMVPVETNTLTKAGATIVLFGLALLWFAFVAIVLSQQKVQGYFKAIACYIDLGVGVIFIGVSATIAISQLI
ncbi:LysE family translocator [Shewanella maritima]|uniref:LysE family translocator n=1 Tax=Shewanella maritima TaxID=2520507 RepID=A0A411PDI5_9GAMM|nr:LysE family translocator [Shewanella maritima]QBF81574.1 LysE family translocator [Shewanella maritima]